jgi:subfamily B ATP-binding cassette protein HlyB/CyaB
MEQNSSQNENQSQGQFDSGLACIVLLARLFELPADPKGLRHQFGRSGQPFDSTDILRAAKDIGLKARLVDSGWDKLRKTRLPLSASSPSCLFYGWARTK